MAIGLHPEGDFKYVHGMKRAIRLYALLLGLLPLTGCAQSVSSQIQQHNLNGLAALKERNYSSARQSFNEAVALDPENVTSIYNLATAAHQSGDLIAAERLYRQCLSKQKAHPSSMHGLAVLLQQQDRGDEAWQMVASWYETEPQSAWANAEYGWLHRERGDFPTAQAYLQRALEIDPNNVRALVELGTLYETYQYPDRTRQLYERASAKAPDQPDIQAKLVRLQGVKPVAPDVRPPNP